MEGRAKRNLSLRGSGVRTETRRSCILRFVLWVFKVVENTAALEPPFFHLRDVRVDRKCVGTKSSSPRQS